ncbi:unnamed protein product [Dovyalis caffra]|uniref:Bestrophin homolog n=1 Tax=Dovyalis caffra TaxID=77055 RepID=A0AAV1SBX9_9ROSI|nr:unnamed protein product [Dovyalis caffra]
MMRMAMTAMIDGFRWPFQFRVLEAVTRKMRCWLPQRSSIPYIFDAAYALLVYSIIYLRREVGIDLGISQEIRCYLTILLLGVSQWVANFRLGRLVNAKLLRARLTMNLLTYLKWDNVCGVIHK